MDILELSSVRSATKLMLQKANSRLEQHTKRDATTFIAVVNGPGLAASVEVYDSDAHRWIDLFNDLAKNWAGWAGEKSASSLEGHLRLACTADSLGHITVQAHLQSSLHLRRDSWCATTTIALEAGQLEAIARSAVRFFAAL